MIATRSDGLASVKSDLGDRIQRIVSQRTAHREGLERAIAKEEGGKNCDDVACEIEGGGGETGSGGESEEPENTVEVPGESCSANPFQEGCPSDNPIDWDDIAEEEVPGDAASDDWKGPDGCRRTLVEIFKEDAYVAHQEASGSAPSG